MSRRVAGAGSDLSLWGQKPQGRIGCTAHRTLRPQRVGFPGPFGLLLGVPEHVYLGTFRAVLGTDSAEQMPCQRTQPPAGPLRERVTLGYRGIQASRWTEAGPAGTPHPSAPCFPPAPPGGLAPGRCGVSCLSCARPALCCQWEQASGFAPAPTPSQAFPSLLAFLISARPVLPNSMLSVWTPSPQSPVFDGLVG